MASDDPHVISITDVKDIDGNDPLVSEFYHNDDGLRTLGNAGELLTRVDLDLAYSSEKLLNLDILFMHVADRAGDCEALLIDNDDISGDSLEKALEFDIVSGILYNEVKELDDFMIFLQEEIMDAREKISSCEHLKAAFAEMVEKLHDSEESLKQSQMQVSDMRGAKFQSTFVFGGLASWNSGFSEISQLSSMHTKVKMQTTDQQRHILKMLEKYLARQLDLEKWLSESRHNEEELKLKLYYAEQEMEEMDLIMERLFEAESIAEVLKGISKELTGKLQIVHFKLSSSTKQEGKMRSMLQEDREKHSTENIELDNLNSDLKEAEDRYDRTNSEALSLREKVISLTENLKESAIQLEEAKASVEENQVQQNILESKIIDLEKLMEALRENLLKSESRAESAEIQCKLLTEDRLKLEQELGSLRGNNTEKVNLLEKQLRQSETQLRHAKASVEASQEQQKMLYSTLNDMENLIKDLKEKSLKGERRAENAEAKCISLTETNLELNEELGFLRGRAIYELPVVSAGENHCTMASDDPHVISITDVKDIDGNDPLDSEFYHNDDGLRTLGSAGELLTRVDLDLAYSSEKLLNLDILFMHVADRAGDCEALLIDNDDISGDSFEKALEFDILSGILYNEVKELDDFMIFLQEEIMDAREKISSCEHLKAAFAEMVEKLHDSEESLKQSQMQVSDMRVQSAKFQSTFVFGGLASWNSGFSEISQLSSMHTKVKMQTTDQQRHILKMLEKSLARELDLEKWLSESRHNEEELKLKLYYAEQEMEEMDLIMERLFEAESIAEVLKGISKELTGKLQIVHFKLSSSTKQEGKMRSMLQEDREKHSTENTELDNLKEAEDKYDRTNSEVLSLREKVISLTENLKESAIQLEEAKASVEENQVQQNILESKIIDLEKLMEALRENLLKSESRAESAEIQCKLLTEDRLKLEQELGSLRGNNTEKVNLLEKQLRQSETQLQHAKASVEASQEQQKMLYSTLNDMENLIKDLKEKSLKAERRAENAEAKCISLTETNLELNEELGFLRGRAEFLEMSLHQANDVKMETAKDIGVRTKVISNLVLQLAMERKRLHTQISSLTKENSVLVEKLSETRKDTYVFMSHNGSTNEESILPKDDGDGAGAQCSLEESVTTSDALSVKADKFAKDASQPAVSAENTACKEPNLGTVRTIEAGQLNRKLVFLAAFILLIAAVAYIFQLESCPF